VPATRFPFRRRWNRLLWDATSSCRRRSRLCRRPGSRFIAGGTGSDSKQTGALREPAVPATLIAFRRRWNRLLRRTNRRSAGAGCAGDPDRVSSPVEPAPTENKPVLCGSRLCRRPRSRVVAGGTGSYGEQTGALREPAVPATQIAFRRRWSRLLRDATSSCRRRSRLCRRPGSRFVAGGTGSDRKQAGALQEPAVPATSRADVPGRCIHRR
jgi:hypothetical protein